jgi:peptidoglycan/LPS O-acetylase OafA/YrhL
MSTGDPSSLIPPDERRLRLLALCYALVLTAVSVAVAIVLWDVKDPRFAYVPFYILFWAFTGGIVSVLMRAAYRRGFDSDEFDLRTWMLIKPFIAVPVGAVVYFLAVSSQLVLTGDSRIPNTEFLNALAFIAGLSDRFAIALFKRVTASYGRGSEATNR